MVRVERRSGRRVYGAWPSNDPQSAVIWEAFKAETEPRRSMREDELPLSATTATRAAPAQRQQRTEQRNRDTDFQERQGQGGIY